MTHHPPPIVFREEAKPRFTITKALLPALLILLLLFLGAQQTRPFELTSAELETLRLQQEEETREMTFRFMDDAQDQVDENPDARFFSDANRILKSAQKEPTEQDSQDPVSEGNTYELKNADRLTEPKPEQLQASASPAQPATPPSQPSQNTQSREQARAEERADRENEADAQVAKDSSERPTDAEELPDEPNEPEGDDQELSVGNVPTTPGAPKPYRKLSKSELEDIREKAQEEWARMSTQPSAPSTPTFSGGSRYHNPGGQVAPNLGFSVDTAGHDLGPYLKTLVQLVKGNWRVPTIAQFEVSGVTVVSFRLHKDGRLTDATVILQSEHEPLDVSALNAINSTYKAPPMPDHIDEPWIPIKFAFYFNMRPRY
ncbi:TonB family protein [Sulfidibacter corallicola]|uniref:TonB family protein n=1 Tax=Sulfidibacter corallicola TaxID=2818388 RepID=A0A8A4TS77_SULCO|nr:energy transducer TonB [Sulfidibacter corallicola]QTD52004.1 TonB family protein [Sulfidibacter corallicola]